MIGAGELRPFGPDIWTAEGPAVTAALGFRYATRMVVIRLADGGVFLWSPVALTDALKAEIDAIGPVRFLIAPNSLHHVFIGDWQRACPQAQVHAAPGLGAKRPDLRLDGTLGDAPAPGWAGQIDQVPVPGNAITTEVVFFHRASRTAIFTDLIQQFPPGWFAGWRGLVARLDGMVGPEPAVPRKFRVAFTGRADARAAVRRILDWPVDRVLMAHGAPVETDGGLFLRRAFGWLTG